MLGDPKVKNHTRYWTPDPWGNEEFHKGCNLKWLACRHLKFLGKTSFAEIVLTQ